MMFKPQSRFTVPVDDFGAPNTAGGWLACGIFPCIYPHTLKSSQSRQEQVMSLLYTSNVCYSNESFYYDELDTLEMSQARQAQAYVKELISQHWLTSTDDSAEPSSVSATTPPTAPTTEVQPLSLVKEKADNLLRMTKNRAILRLRSIA